MQTRKKGYSYFYYIALIFFAPSSLANGFQLTKNTMIREVDFVEIGRDAISNPYTYRDEKIYLPRPQRAKSKRVVVGKGGWLFYDAFESNDGMGFGPSLGYQPLSESQLYLLRSKLEDEARWMSGQKIPFILMPCPDKQSVYPEFLPQEWLRKGEGRLDQIFQTMRDVRGVKVIDVRHALENAKRSFKPRLYYKTDTHWNTVGGFIAYLELMKYLIEPFPGMRTMQFSDMRPLKDGKMVGDLLRFQDIDTNQGYEDELEPLPKAGNTGTKVNKLILFGDSFASSLRPLLVNHFNEIVFINGARSAQSPIDRQLILEEKPDVVILESVERYWTKF